MSWRQKVRMFGAGLLIFCCLSLAACDDINQETVREITQVTTTSEYVPTATRDERTYVPIHSLQSTYDLERFDCGQYDHPFRIQRSSEGDSALMCTYPQSVHPVSLVTDPCFGSGLSGIQNGIINFYGPDGQLIDAIPASAVAENGLMPRGADDACIAVPHPLGEFSCTQAHAGQRVRELYPSIVRQNPGMQPLLATGILLHPDGTNTPITDLESQFLDSGYYCVGGVERE